MSNHSSPIFRPLKWGRLGGGVNRVGILVPAALAHGAWFARPARVFHFRADSRVHGQRFARDHDITRRETHSGPRRCPLKQTVGQSSL